MHSVFLALPAYGAVEPEQMLAVVETVYSAKGKLKNLVLASKSMSLLAHCFNHLWCDALNKRGGPDAPTVFAMLHADICPQSDWLPWMIEEMERVDADILSAVVPIKDNSRDTSTAYYDPEAQSIHRLHVSELDELPGTFDASAFPGKKLLINTGCWVCRFDRPWVEKVWFEIDDRIKRNAEGKWEPIPLSEDWKFSMLAEKAGARVFATQKLTLTHFGRQGWTWPGKVDEEPGREEPVAELEEVAA